MRTILFRGKRTDNGEWVEGSLGIDNREEPHSYYIYSPKDYEALVKIDPSTIGQFTGLTDKNGKMIFEGDKYKCRYYTGTPGDFRRHIGEVKYVTTAFVVAGIGKYYGLHAQLYANGEVIDNIHDTRNEGSN